MAKSDETARRIYKYLISLQTDCSDIQKLVKESGNLSREIKDLEDQVCFANFVCLFALVSNNDAVCFVIRRKPNYVRILLPKLGDCKVTSNRYARKIRF
jgi:hypothetical protein